MIRVLVADDHPLIRLSLGLVIEAAPDLDLCGSAENGVSAVSIAQETVPDVVLLDVSMPGGDGIEATRQLKHLMPATRVIILTWLASCEASARDAGADDFLLKDVPPQTLLEHIRRVPVLLPHARSLPCPPIVGAATATHSTVSMRRTVP